MARKRKNRKSSTDHKQKNPKLTTETQEKRAHALFAAKKYKEASEYCKNLLKQEKRPEWIELLAKIYLERSKELTAKGMYKEAVMIWRNRAELCEKPLADAFYFRTLLAAGMNEQILALYQHDSTTLKQTGCLAEVREHLAALSLGQSSDVLTKLPADDILTKDHPIALAALEAYCAGNDEMLHDLLSKISFRSPFRDLRQILKALSLPENDTSATELLGRIASSSPFSRLAEAITLSSGPDSHLFSSISNLKPGIAEFIVLKKGFNDEMLAFFAEWRKLGSSPSADTLLRFISNHQEMLGKQVARELALKLLVHLPHAPPVFIKTFGKPSPLELARADALSIELKRTHPVNAIRAWEYVESLLKPEDCQSPAHCKLCFALIGHRRLQHADKVDNNERDPSINNVLEWIIQNDPKDHPSYLRLISSYRKQGKLKEARKSIEQAMSHFSNDIAILTEATETALASKAYKKAAVLAKKILEKDPINTRVRNALIDAHLSHARKLINNRKYNLAEKELDIAESWGKTPEDRAKVDLVRGTLLLDQKQVPETTAIWKAATKTLGGGFSGHFYLLQELLQQNRSVRTILKKTEIKLNTQSVTEKHLLQFFQSLNHFKKNKQTNNIEETLKLLKPALEKMAKLKHSPADFEMICEVLDTYNSYSLYWRYAKEARKQWPEELVFTYHAIAAKTAVDGYLTEDNFDTLDYLIEETTDNGQNKLKERAINLIQNSERPPSEFGFDPDFNFGFDTNTPPNVDTLINMLLEIMPNHVIKELKKDLGEKGFMEYMRNMISGDMEAGIDDDEDEDEYFNPFTQPPKKKKKPPKRQLESS